MFIYQKDGKLSITFDDNKPVPSPAINFDLTEETLTVNDQVIEPIVSESLTEDLVLPTAEVVTGAKTVVLNGHTISAPEDTAGDGVYCVKQGGYLTINGDGVINGVGNNGYNMALWANGGHIVVNGGTITNVGAKSDSGDADSHFDLIYAKEGGVVEINGGYFECETPKWTLNLNDKNPGKIIVRGGTFYDFDPSKAETEPGGLYNFVDDGYKVVRKDNLYTVVKI